MNFDYNIQHSSMAYRDEILDLYRRHVNSGQAKLASLMNLQIENTSAGTYVTDNNGRSYLDVGGYGVFLLGHGHPEVVDAVVEQIRVNALSSRLLVNPQQAHAAAALISKCPARLQYVYFCNSGAEATEAAVKLARLNGCEVIVSATGGYHGKTMGALSVTGNANYREPFADMLNDTLFVEFGNSYQLAALLKTVMKRACVIVEPIQGEAGVIIPPSDYLRQVREICDQHDALLIFDEIQSGMGRSGYWWASEPAQVSPDIMLVGKILSGGCIPVGAMIATAHVYEPFNKNPFIHTSTFGGNPAAMVAVKATIEAIDRNNLIERAKILGALLLDRISKVIEELNAQDFVKIRGVGLLIGLEFTKASHAAQMILALLDEGVVVCHSLNQHRVIRLTPPAILTDADCDLLMNALFKALNRTIKCT